MTDDPTRPDDEEIGDLAVDEALPDDLPEEDRDGDPEAGVDELPPVIVSITRSK